MADQFEHQGLLEKARKDKSKLDEHLEEIGQVYFTVENIRPFQREAVKAFLDKKHVIVNTPTGHGKSLCYQILPQLIDNLSNSYGSVILVVSPLIALMQDQVNTLNSKGFKAAHLTAETDFDKIVSKEDGSIIPTYIFVSPESLSQNKLRNLLISDEFRRSCVGVAIDEAHCITAWGYASQKAKLPFRIWYSRLNELNALLSHLQYVILSATMTPSTKAKIITTLGIDPTRIHTISISPIKENLIFKNVFIGGSSPLDIFEQYAELLMDGKIDKRVMIITQTKTQASNIYSKFEEFLEEKIYKNEDFNVRERIVEMFHRITPGEVKDHIIRDMTDDNGNIKILVCTNAFGMGIDTKNVNTIIHFGPSKSVESYLQECGRAGRDGSMSNCVLFYNGILCATNKIQEEMSQYVYNVKSCRRESLKQCFDIKDLTEFKGCLCCDICLRYCDCYRPHDIMEWFDGYGTDVRRRQKVSNEIKSQLEVDLRYAFQGTVYNETPVMIPNTYFQFGEYQIQQILDNIEKIFNIEDVRQWVEIWVNSHAFKVLQTLESYFDDISLPTSPAEEKISKEWHVLAESENESEDINIENDTPQFLDDTILETTIDEQSSFIQEE